jgi:hypothetical protein
MLKARSEKRVPAGARVQMSPTRIILLLFFAVLSCGCSTLASRDETGVVIARRAQVRSSTAVVAADLKEVVRGDELEILDSTLVQETGEEWLRVKTRDAEPIEGWIEGRNVISQEMVERSRQLASEDADIPAQATGQLRASTNIRFSPDRSSNGNILMKLESGARFEIVGWKRVPRPQTLGTAERDDAPKSGSAANRRSGRPGEDQAPKEEQEDANELWYKVRLPASLSPAPAGWVFGKQVELTVPSDIIFYRTGREFVAWQRLDGEGAESSSTALKDKDAAKDSRPGSWVILEKSSTGERGPDSPAFDRIFVLGYDKDRQEHYTAYRSHDLQGHLPLQIINEGGTRYFTVRAQHDGELKPVRFKVYFNDRGLLKVESQGDLPKPTRSR